MMSRSCLKEWHHANGKDNLSFLRLNANHERVFGVGRKKIHSLAPSIGRSLGNSADGGLKRM